MNPKFLESYGDELYNFLKNEEGFREKVYPCSKGVPTIGVGYALAERVGTSFTVRQEIDKDLANIRKGLSNKDKKRLVILCDLLNNGKINQAKSGNDYIDDFDLIITEEEAKQLFKLCIPKYDGIVKQKLGLKLYKELQNSHEMVALFSLAYNAPSLIGKNLVAGLKEGNRAKVQYEILYGSNKDRHIGLQNRRVSESEQFGRYDDDIATELELQREEEVQKAHRAQIAAYDNALQQKRQAKKAKPTRTVHHEKRQQPKPGAVPNQKEVKHRIDKVKVRSDDGGHFFDRIIELFSRRDKVPKRNWGAHPAGHDDAYYHKRWS